MLDVVREVCKYCVAVFVCISGLNYSIVVSVSYTHLDVYKRQVPGRAAN